MTYKYERKYPTQCPFLRACGLERGEAWLLQVGMSSGAMDASTSM